MLTCIFKFPDLNSIYQLTLSSKIFEMWLKNDNLWSQKLIQDYQFAIPYMEFSAKESYKWCTQVPIMIDRILIFFNEISRDDNFNGNELKLFNENCLDFWYK